MLADGDQYSRQYYVLKIVNTEVAECVHTRTHEVSHKYTVLRLYVVALTICGGRYRSPVTRVEAGRQSRPPASGSLAKWAIPRCR